MSHFRYGGKNIAKELTWQSINVEFGPDAEHFLLLVDLLLTIPAHSAECERGFSLLKTIKTDWRNKLSDSAVTDLIRIALESADIKLFNPDTSIHAWNKRSIRGRRPNQKRWRTHKKSQEPVVAGPAEDLSVSDDADTSDSDSSDSDCDSDSHTETMSVSDSDEDQIGNNDMLELFNTDSDESDFDGF